MSQLRTYRVLPLLLGLALLFGAAAPAVQAACAMMPEDVQETTMPCLGHEAAALVLNAHQDQGDVPCEVDPSEQYHACCQQDGAAPSPAVMCSDAGPRIAGLVLAGVLPSDLASLRQPRSATFFARAQVPSFPSSHRQAFLATFLI